MPEPTLEERLRVQAEARKLEKLHGEKQGNFACFVQAVGEVFPGRDPKDFIEMRPFVPRSEK